MSERDTKLLLTLAQAHVDRVYVAQADDRQREMGLAYVTAERTDLAREMVKFAYQASRLLEWPL